MTRQLHRLSPAAADRLRELAPTYDDVGATLRGETPAGYRPFEHRAVLGRGPALFDRASEALLSWEVQLRSGIAVRASSATVEPGAVAMLRLGIGPFGVRAPVRVLTVLDEPGRRGFVYGTLPGHPESGEELFSVVYDDNEVVALRLVAFSRPGTALARVAGPLGRWAQHVMTRRYGRALRA